MKIPTDWTFKNTGVAKGFDAHVREQLPWYDLATGAVAHIARHYIPHSGLVFDVGTSTGNLGRAIGETLLARSATLVPVDNSAEMLKEYDGPGDPICADAREVDYSGADVIVAFLVLMFVPYQDRTVLVRRWYDALNFGGAMIIFDKIEAPRGYIGTVIRRLTLAGKVATGTPSDQIIQKELSLSGVQRPISPSFIEYAAPNAVEVFRWGEFAGWVIEKNIGA